MKEEETVFEMWKEKLLKHEERHAMVMNYEYRSEKKINKTLFEKMNNTQ
jgi:hypothetical protein